MTKKIGWLFGGEEEEFVGIVEYDQQPKRVMTETVLDALATKVEEGGSPRALEGGPYGFETQALRLETRPRKRSVDSSSGKNEPIPKPTRKRWIMLFYLSALAMLSDWICFSAAPIAVFVQRNLNIHDSHLVTCFLATNVAFCLLEPAAVRRFGLRPAVVGGAVTMALGCILRFFASEAACGPWLNVTSPTTPRMLAVLGTMLVGAAQPFFQCTPSLLAANWFGENETTFAATMALNANQLGIAGSYAVGAIFVHSNEALRRYFFSLALVSVVLAFACFMQFSERPPKPPSYSALESLRREAASKERLRCFESLRQESRKLNDDSPRPTPSSSTRGGFDKWSDASSPRPPSTSTRSGYDKWQDDASSPRAPSTSTGRDLEDVDDDLLASREDFESQQSLSPRPQSSSYHLDESAHEYSDGDDARGLVSSETNPPRPEVVGDREEESKYDTTSPRSVVLPSVGSRGFRSARGDLLLGAGARKDSLKEMHHPPLLRRWLVNYRRVGHGALDVTRNMLSELRVPARFVGFDSCLVAFVASIVASNIFSTFLPHLVTTARRRGEPKNMINFRIAALGSGFQVAIMGGSLFFGGMVDATKAYKVATCIAFAGSLLALVAIADDSTRGHFLEFSVLALGFFVGPIQPISAELAVDVTYPEGDENTIVAIQQTAGNLLSAAAVPIFHAISELSARTEFPDCYGIRLDYAVLAVVTFLAAVYFRVTVWHARLRRLEYNTSANKNGDADAVSNIELFSNRPKYMSM